MSSWLRAIAGERAGERKKAGRVVLQNGPFIIGSRLDGGYCMELEETRWVRIPSFCRPVCTFLQTACRPVCTFCRPLADRSALFADRLQTGRRLRLHCVRRCRCRRGGVAVAGRGRRSESGDVGPSGGAGILQTGEISSNRMIGAGVLSGPGPRGGISRGRVTPRTRRNPRRVPPQPRRGVRRR